MKRGEKMLKEFKVKNFKSFKDEQIFSLEAMNRQEPNLDYFNIAQIGGQRILKSAAIYGHNSYGKSNLFKAVGKMLQIIKLCINSDYIIEVDNFKLDNFSMNEPTMFEITFVQDEITYRYGFEILKNLVTKEWLYKTKKREVKIFERKNQKNNSIELSSKYKKIEKYKEFTKESELFLSSMEKNNISGEIRDVYNFLVSNIKVFSAEDMVSTITSEMVMNKIVSLSQIISALKSADLGISNLEIKKEEQNLEEVPEFIKSIVKFGVKDKISDGKIYSTCENIKHNIFSKDGKNIGEINFELNENESEGTKKLYSVIGPILNSIDKGQVLFIDELDSKLHHFIVKYIIELFNNNDINLKNAQLIFNTHDFYLFKEEIFRRDQIYFVDKDSQGRSNLYSLGDFKGIDKKTNLLAHYLLGHFGAVGNIN